MCKAALQCSCQQTHFPAFTQLLSQRGCIAPVFFAWPEDNHNVPYYYEYLIRVYPLIICLIVQKSGAILCLSRNAGVSAPEDVIDWRLDYQAA